MNLVINIGSRFRRGLEAWVPVNVFLAQYFVPSSDIGQGWSDWHGARFPTLEPFSTSNSRLRGFAHFSIHIRYLTDFRSSYVVKPIEFRSS